MRYHQLLLEYDHSKTVQNYGPGIIQHLIKDETTANGSGWFDYVEEYKESKISAEKCASLFVTFVEKLDTTPNKKYVQWICRMYATGGIARVEDFYRTREAIEHLHTLKTSGYFQRNREAIPHSDINRYRTLGELEEFLDSLDDRAVISNAEADRPDPNEYRIILDTDRWRVVTPFTQNAASYFGRNTKWCTTSENGGMFTRYKNRGPLYIIIDKPKNRRWQWHFETRQYMNERDYPISIGSFDKEFLELMPDQMISKYIENEPNGILNIDSAKLQKFTPKMVSELSKGNQEAYVWRGYSKDKEANNTKLYRECLKEVSTEALCGTYSVGWHWDNGVYMLIELKNRAESDTIDRKMLELEGEHWKVTSFATIVDACIYDLKTENHSPIWKILDQELRGSLPDRFEQTIKNLKNTVILESLGKKYFFTINSRQLQYVFVNWEYRDATVMNRQALQNHNHKTFTPSEYKGVNKPELWDAVCKALGLNVY